MGAGAAVRVGDGVEVSVGVDVGVAVAVGVAEAVGLESISSVSLPSELPRTNGTTIATRMIGAARAPSAGPFRRQGSAQNRLQPLRALCIQRYFCWNDTRASSQVPEEL